MSEWKGYIGQPNKQFYCANASLKTNELQKESFEQLGEYMSNLCSSHKSEEWVFNTIFGKNKPMNFELAHIYAANISLNRVLKRKSFNEFKNPVIVEFLEDLICDIKEYIRIIDPEQDFSWLLINTNHSLSNFYYDEVCNLLYGEQKKNANSDAKFNLATLVIRHALEQRIKNLIGLDFILKDNQPVPFSDILNAIKKLSNLEKRTDIDFNRLEKINNWANHYLHRGLRPAPWQLEWAENEIKKLFYKGKTLDEQSLSLFASFETKDFINLRKEFENLICQKYSDKKVKFFWASGAEINVSRNLIGNGI